METIKLAYSYITDPTDGGVTRTNSTDDDGDGGGELVRLDQHESYYITNPVVKSISHIISNLFCFLIMNHDFKIIKIRTNPIDVSGTSTTTSTTANAYRAVVIVVVVIHGSIH